MATGFLAAALGELGLGREEVVARESGEASRWQRLSIGIILQTWNLAHTLHGRMF